MVTPSPFYRYKYVSTFLKHITTWTETPTTECRSLPQARVQVATEQ